MGRYLRYYSSKNLEAIEVFLNGLTDISIVGAPVWDGKRWVAWVLVKNKKQLSQDLDK